MQEDISKKIKSLAKKIVKASNDYYNSNPSVSDKLWDAWFDELKKLDPTHPVITGIGSLPVSEWAKVQHEISMASLNKAQSIDEFKEWVEKDCNNIITYLCSEKLDGISVSVKYENGEFVKALSRGDGKVGEDITVNVCKMKNVKLQLNNNFSGHIRGEIILLKSDHVKYFPDYANPRNAASGIAKRYDGEGVEHLSVLFYKIEGEDFTTEDQSFKKIESLGLKTPNYKVVDINCAIEMWNSYQSSIRDSLDYEIDGLVFAVNDCGQQYALGDKGRGPVGSIAFKFDAASAESIIKDIAWQVGPTGRVTPVAVFDEINLVGVKINRASIYNYSYIKELGIGIGATVLVIRSNDVIPAITEVIVPTSTAKYPKYCPDCNNILQFKGEYLVCDNKINCPPQVLGRISAWVSELGILEWGDKVIQKMIDANIVSDISDIYTISIDQIASLDKMGERSAKALLKELDKFKEVSLHNLIGGLGIENIATSTVKLVVNAGYDSLDLLENISISELENISGFGSIKAHSFYNGMRDNKHRIQKILDAGVSIKSKVKGTLSNKSFCFSGSSILPRKQLQKIVEDCGGEIKNTVGKNLTYLVLADPLSASSKTKAAQKNGVQIISEEDFIQMAGV